MCLYNQKKKQIKKKKKKKENIMCKLHFYYGDFSFNYGHKFIIFSLRDFGCLRKW